MKKRPPQDENARIRKAQPAGDRFAGRRSLCDALIPKDDVLRRILEEIGFSFAAEAAR
jgi:hypothetical protein